MTDTHERRLLSELDYLTTPEAAEYCRVSESQFREHASAYGIVPFKLMGKILYRKVDLKSVLESAWLVSTRGPARQARRSGT